jgi:predicted O-methyltransferase YrrM
MGRIVSDTIETYLSSLGRVDDPVLAAVAERGRVMELPLIDAEVGKFLEVLVRATGAARVLEIGAAIGYSGLWLARGLPPDGQLFTIELDPERARMARAHFDEAGLGSRVHVMVGDAARLVHKVTGPFDLIFQDGHKPQYVELLDRLIALLGPRGLLVADNVLWEGEVVPGLVAEPRRRKEDTDAIVAYNRALSACPHLLTSWIPLRDGLAVSVKRDAAR